MPNDIIRIGRPGKFDPTFGLKKQYRRKGQNPRHVYIPIWLETGKKVKGLKGYLDPIYVEKIITERRKELIDKEFENILLVNE